MILTRMTLAALLAGGGAAALAQQPVRLPPVIIESAARDARAILDTPVAASVIGREALDRRQATTFEELIGDAPGVTIEGGPRGIAQEPNIRGFQDEQIVLRFDGGRFNFNQAHRGRFFVDPEIVERVEIVRGGGSTLFGSGALGGVIDVRTRDAADLLAPGERFGARLRAGYASNGDIGQVGATAFGNAGAVDGLVFLGWRPQGSDLEDGGGTVIRSSQIDVVNGLVKLGAEPTPASRFELGASFYRDDGTTPPNANAAASADTDVDRDAEVTTLRVGWDYAPAGSDHIDLSVLGYFNGLDIEEDRNADGRADVTRYDTLGVEAVNRSRFTLGAPVTVVYGVEALRDRQEGRRDGAARAQFPDAEATTLAGFAEATIIVTDTLEITPGLRLDHYQRDPDSEALPDVDDVFFSPRIGVSFRPAPAWQIFGNVARAFRAPSLTELYNDGVHFATPGFPLGPGTTFTGVNSFVPNPDLDPEESTQIEIGARFGDGDVLQAGDALSVSVNAYYADVRNFIDQRVTFIDFATAQPGPGGLFVGGTTSSSNVDATLWGAELEADYDARAWFAGLSLSIPRGEGEDGAPLGAIPQDRLTATLGWRPAPDVEIGGRATLAAEQDDVPEGAEAAGAYATLDLFASWRPTGGPLAGAEFRAGVDNVTDVNYRIHPNGLNQPGRSFKLSAAIRF